MRSVFVKQGPIVFLKDLLVMELFALILFFLASFIENYEMLYLGWSLDNYLRYDIFILIGASLFQLFYLIILFLNWYFSYFEIKDSEITKKSGLIFHSKKSIQLADIVSVETYQSPLDRLIRHATVILEHKDGKLFKIQNISNYEEYVSLIKRSLHKNGSKHKSYDVKELISQGENSEVEFKETLRYDTHTNQVNKELEKVIVKTIVGFLNTEGGNLLIGIKDDTSVVGVLRDYSTLPKKNEDGFENHLTMLIKSMIGINFTKNINISFHNVNGQEICLIKIEASNKPAYLKNPSTSSGQAGKEEFFVRTGNSTQPLSMSDAQEYIQTHFKN